MRSKKLFIGLIVLLICAIGIPTFAASESLVLTGDSTNYAGKTGTVYLKVSSDKELGSITFVMNKSDNISSLKCTEENGWTKTVNESTSKYNVFKAAGGKSENILKIEYTLSEDAKDTATIEIKDVTAATIDGEDLDLENSTKTITIKAEELQEPQEPEKPENDSNAGVDNNKLNNTNTQNNNSTTANKTITYAGLENYTFAGIALLALVAFIAYVKYKQYKNI